MSINVIPYTEDVKLSAPGIYSLVPMSRYHGPNLCDAPSISSSGLRSIFSKSPMEYWVESPYNPNKIDVADKAEFTLGRATHHLALGETGFPQQFAIRPDKWDSWRGDPAKAWRALKQIDGITVLDDKMVDQVKGMMGVLPWQKGLEDSGLNNHGMFRGGILGGLIEHSIVFRDKETGVWIKVRPDAIPLDDTVAADLKTSLSVTDEAISKTLGAFRYDMQAALIRRALREICGIDITNFALVFVMKKPPYAVRTIEIDTADMDEAEMDIQVALRTFAKAMETGRWIGPGGGQTDGKIIRLKKWDRDRADERRALLEMALEGAA